MYNLTLTNDNGNQLTFNQLGGPFTITEITGLNPPTATINTNTTAILDGARFNSSKLDMRSIQIAFAIDYDAATNRLEVYKVLQSKKHITLAYTSEVIDVVTDGYVQSIDVTYFEMKQVVTVSILCPFPYFKSAQAVVNDLSNLINLFHFPFASTEEGEIVFGYIETVNSVNVINNGTTETGMVIELYAKASVTNPKIYNYITQEFIGLDFTMEAADLITIDTTAGNKTITLLRDGVESNIFNSLMQNSTWLQLNVGGNEFVYTVDGGSSENLNVIMIHNDLFEGV